MQNEIWFVLRINVKRKGNQKMFLEMKNVIVRMKTKQWASRLIKCSCFRSDWSGISNQRNFQMWSNRDETY